MKKLLTLVSFIVHRVSSIVLLLLSVSGCQHFNPTLPSQIKPLLQLSTAELSREISVVQKVNANYQGRQQSFIAQLEITKNELIMVGLTEFGAKLFTLRYDNRVIDYQPSPLLKMPMDPAFLLSDLQLIYWPIKSIKAALAVEQQLQQSEVAPFKRQLFIAKQQAVTIRYSNKQPWLGSVSFRQLQNNYALDIQTLDISEL
jgi:hypothetical protein